MESPVARIVNTQLSAITRLEMAEAETWHDYQEVHREWEVLKKFGRKAEAERMRKRALSLNYRHARIMRQIMFMHRQALFGNARG